MKYLLADARDVKDSGPSPYEGDNNLVLAIQRHGPSHVRARARNRLSLDLDLPGPHAPVESQELGKDHVRYRRRATEGVQANRHSLNLDLLNGQDSQSNQYGGRRTVHFSIPGSPDANQRQTFQDGHQDTIRRRYRPPDRTDSGSDGESAGDCVGVSPRLLKLLEIKPKDYAEAQRLKKMLKRAVSRPDTTFEDLKVYRIAMKRLRRIVRQEQEKEIMRQEEEERQENFQKFIDKVEQTRAASGRGLPGRTGCRTRPRKLGLTEDRQWS